MDAVIQGDAAGPGVAMNGLVANVDLGVENRTLAGDQNVLALALRMVRLAGEGEEVGITGGRAGHSLLVLMHGLARNKAVHIVARGGLEGRLRRGVVRGVLGGTAGRGGRRQAPPRCRSHA